MLEQKLMKKVSDLSLIFEDNPSRIIHHNKGRTVSRKYFKIMMLAG